MNDADALEAASLAGVVALATAGVDCPGLLPRRFDTVDRQPVPPGTVEGDLAESIGGGFLNVCSGGDVLKRRVEENNDLPLVESCEV